MSSETAITISPCPPVTGPRGIGMLLTRAVTAPRPTAAVAPSQRFPHTAARQLGRSAGGVWARRSAPSCVVVDTFISLSSRNWTAASVRPVGAPSLAAGLDARQGDAAPSKGAERPYARAAWGGSVITEVDGSAAPVRRCGHATPSLREYEEFVRRMELCPREQ